MLHPTKKGDVPRGIQPASGAAFRFLGFSTGTLLVGILLVALALRLVFIFGYTRAVLHDLPENQTNDGYDAIAEHLYQGEGYRIHATHPPTLERPPAYPVLIFLVFKAVGINYAVVQVLHALLGALCAYLLFLLGRWAAGPRTGLLAALFFAGYPSAVQYSANICSENLYFPLVAALAYFLCRMLDRGGRRGHALAAGAAWGLANLTRGTLLPFPLLLLPALLLMRDHRRQVGRWLPRVAMAMLAAACVMSPWLLRNHALTGAIVPVSSWSWAPFYHGQQCAKQMLSGRDLVAVDKAASRQRRQIVIDRLYAGDATQAYRSPREYLRHEEVARDLVLAEIRRDPGGAFLRALIGLPLSWFQTLRAEKRPLSALIHLPMLLLAILGAVRLQRREPERFGRLYPALVLILFFNALTAVIFPYVRYMAPAVAVSFLFSAHQVAAWWPGAADRGLARNEVP